MLSVVGTGTDPQLLTKGEVPGEGAELGEGQRRIVLIVLQCQTSHLFGLSVNSLLAKILFFNTHFIVLIFLGETEAQRHDPQFRVP